MAKDEIGPVPTGLTSGASGTEVPNAIEWLNNLVSRVQREASTTDRGDVLQAEAQADSTAATVADLVTDFNSLLAKLRTAGILAE